MKHAQKKRHLFVLQRCFLQRPVLLQFLLLHQCVLYVICKVLNTTIKCKCLKYVTNTSSLFVLLRL